MTKKPIASYQKIQHKPGCSTSRPCEACSLDGGALARILEVVVANDLESDDPCPDGEDMETFVIRTIRRAYQQRHELSLEIVRLRRVLDAYRLAVRFYNNEGAECKDTREAMRLAEQER